MIICVFKKRKAMKKQIVFLTVALLGATSAHALWNMPNTIGLPMDVGKHGYLSAPAVRYDLAYRAFDSNKDQVALHTLVLGKSQVKIKDIYFLSMLAGLGHTSLTTNDYIRAINNAVIDFDFEEKRFQTSIEGSVTLPLFDSDTHLTVGVQLPFEYYKHYINKRYDFTGVGLLGTQAGDNNLNLQYFFNNNATMDSFIEQEILAPKGLTMHDVHRTFGLGSPRIFALVDISHAWDDDVQKAQFGFEFVRRAPQGDTHNIVWPAIRGWGANYVGVNLALELDFTSCMRPYLKGEVFGALRHTEKMRVPKQKTSTGAGSLSDNDVITASGIHTMTIDTAYTLYDSLVPFFADAAIEVARRRGGIANLEIGNRMLLKEKVDTRLYMQLRHKSKDSVKSTDNTPSRTYDYNMIKNRTNQLSYTFGWEARYGLKAGATISTGSEHVIKAENSPQYHSWFLRTE
ncbi:MAG: hypothetical protein ACJAZS_000132, partial [Alteromonas naphthalenivorans]